MDVIVGISIAENLERTPVTSLENPEGAWANQGIQSCNLKYLGGVLE